MSDIAPSGLKGVDGLPWGSHYCHFFPSGDTLRETLVPYLKAGLENDERCLVIATDPFGTDDARGALRAAVGDFDRREASGQIDIQDVRSWYAAGGTIDGERLASVLFRCEEQARSDGYRGLRTHGNLGWIGRGQWPDLKDYEAHLARGLKGRRMISMCSYCLEKCRPEDVLDVIERHDVALGRGIEGMSVVAASAEELARRSAMEQRLTMLVQELEHRIRNSLATVQALVGSTIRSAGTLEEFEKSFGTRIGALARRHSLLAAGDQEHVGLRELVDNELALYAERGSGRITITGPDIELESQPAMSFGMALHELVTNAVKHGALSSKGGRLDIAWERLGAGFAFDWIEKAVDLPAPPVRVGFGTQLLNRLLPHQLGASVRMDFERDGLKARFEIPS